MNIYHQLKLGALCEATDPNFDEHAKIEYLHIFVDAPEGQCSNHEYDCREEITMATPFASCSVERTFRDKYTSSVTVFQV